MKQIFTAFIEHKEFKKSRPWSVVKQVYDTAIISTPHYADTVELLVCSKINGTAYIGGKKLDMSGEKVLYISPQTVHSFEYLPSEGHLLVIKLHPAMLGEFIDIDRILAEYGASLQSLDITYENYSDFLPHVKNLEENTDIARSLSSILAILRLLVSSSHKKSSSDLSVDSLSCGNAEVINEIIAWTEKNYGRKFTLDEVSGRFGYTKNYFCDMFKAKTGITYLKYLNNMRISNACAMLKAGTPVREVSQLCGFETDSYFIQLFKKIIGITPKQYQIK